MRWDLYGLNLSPWVYVPAFLFLWLAGGLMVRALLRRLVGADHGTKFLRVLAHAFSLPLVLFIFVSGPIALLMWTPMGDRMRATVNLNFLLASALVLAVGLFLDRLIREIVDVYSDSVELFRSAGGLLKGLERGLIITLGALIILDTFGISITPVLASLGIGSLAVALALQPTLENVFAGMQIVMDRPIRLGHFIRLESGEEGYVEKIGWRSTWIRMLSNNMVIIPNKQLVGSRVTNYYYPTKDMGFSVDLGADYGADLEKIERITIEVAQEVTKTVKGAVATHQPAVRFHTFGDARINFSVGLRAEEFTDNYLIKHEFIKALQKRYAQEGIEIPTPIRAFSLQQPEKPKT